MHAMLEYLDAAVRVATNATRTCVGFVRLRTHSYAWIDALSCIIHVQLSVLLFLWFM